MLTEHEPVPLHAPPQPENTHPDAGDALIVTDVPCTYCAEHVLPQLIPDGLLVTVPDPERDTVNVRNASKVAVHSRLCVMLTVVDALVPLQAPLHPVKTEPAAADALSVTVVPFTNGAEQVVPQSIPDGLLDTVPEPDPLRVTVKVRGTSKRAVTLRASVMVTVHEPVPEQAPLHPWKLLPLAALAVSVTLDPSTKSAEQVAPQLIPAGLLVTVPDPEPMRDTDSVSRSGSGGRLNVAVTLRACVMLTVHCVPLALWQPDQPANVEPDAVVAVNVTLVPGSNCAEHVAPQLIPDGLLLTVPVPVPDRETLNVGRSAKVAEQVRCWVKLTVVLALVPLHAPVQPANTEPEAGAAVSVTFVAYVNCAEHVLPHVIPDGLLETLPEPVPERFTVNVRGPSKRAVTLRASVMLTTHVSADPEHAPPHSTNTLPLAALALSVTAAPSSK